MAVTILGLTKGMGYIYKFLTKLRFGIHKGSRLVDFVRELHLLQNKIKSDFSL